MPRFVDQLKCGTRGQKKTSQASDHVIISMWEVITNTKHTRIRSPGWRIHGGVEDTKLNTNKQHSLEFIGGDKDRQLKPCVKRQGLVTPYMG
jgi:hypothetical protein